jgi:hypothetical protein
VAPCMLLRVAESSSSLSSLLFSSLFVLCSIHVFSCELTPRELSSFCSLVPSSMFSPEGPSDMMGISTEGLNDGVLVQIEVWALESAWADLAGSMIIHGNTTTSSRSKWEKRIVYSN